MDIQVNREKLLAALQTVVGVVERRQSLPILANVLLTVKEDQLELQATDLEMQVACHTQVQNIQPGSVSAPARKLHDICRGLPLEADVHLQLDNDKLRLHSGRSRFMLATLPAEEFPRLDGEAQSHSLTLSAHTLRELIVRTQFAMAQQDVRYYLNGLLIEIGQGELKAVATDGHRLAVATEAFQGNDEVQGQYILPRKTVLELARLLDKEEADVQLELSPTQLTVTTDATTLVSKLVDGKYPEYQRVIPENGDRQVRADRESVRTALARAAILSNEKFRGVRLGFTADTMRIETQNPEQEEALEELEVEFSGDDLEIGFNVNYLLEALSAIDGDQFVIDMRGPDSSGLLYDPERPQYKYVVMPMRL